MSYAQLTHAQRYVIEILDERGETQQAIGEVIGKHKSTVSRELSRNSNGDGYQHELAHQFALERRSGKAKPEIPDDIWATVEMLLNKKWSPEQISDRVKKEETGSVSHTWIYEYIESDKAEGGTLYENLRHPTPYKKRGSSDGRGRLQNRVPIDERPDEVDEKERIGDWEADLVMGANHKGALVTMVERVSKYSVIGHVKRKTAEGVKEEQIKCLSPYEEDVITITTDNGKEFARHEDVADQLEVSIFFADPYASWQRGLNENTNGLIRQYFPKGRELRDVDWEEIQQVQDELNHRPRKTLNYRTPHEVFHETTNQLTVALTT